MDYLGKLVAPVTWFCRPGLTGPRLLRQIASLCENSPHAGLGGRVRRRISRSSQGSAGALSHTLEAYRRDLAQFFAYCAGEGVGAIGVRRQHARLYLAALSAEGYSKRSMTRKASAVRSFYNDAGRRNSAPVNPFEGVSRPRLDKPLPHALLTGHWFTPSRRSTPPPRKVSRSCPDRHPLFDRSPGFGAGVALRRRHRR